MVYVSYIQAMLPRTIQIQLLSLTDMKLVRVQKTNYHLRRSREKIEAEVHFKEDMILQGKKDDFLANVVNKQQFIYLLSEKLTRQDVPQCMLQVMQIY